MRVLVRDQPAGQEVELGREFFLQRRRRDGVLRRNGLDHAERGQAGRERVRGHVDELGDAAGEAGGTALREGEAAEGGGAGDAAVGVHQDDEGAALVGKGGDQGADRGGVVGGGGVRLQGRVAGGEVGGVHVEAGLAEERGQGRVVGRGVPSSVDEDDGGGDSRCHFALLFRGELSR